MCEADPTSLFDTISRGLLEWNIGRVAPLRFVVSNERELETSDLSLSLRFPDLLAA
jgi:hypothetical protein